MSDIKDSFVSNINHILIEMKSDWRVYKQEKLFMLIQPENDFEFLDIYTVDGQEIDSIKILSTEEDTAKLVIQLEGISKKFFNQGVEMGRKTLAYELRNLLGVSNSDKTYS